MHDPYFKPTLENENLEHEMPSGLGGLLGRANVDLGGLGHSICMKSDNGEEQEDSELLKPFIADPDFGDMLGHISRKAHEFFGLHRPTSPNPVSKEEQLRFIHGALGKVTELDPQTRDWHRNFVLYRVPSLGEKALTQLIEVPALNKRTVATSLVYRRPEIREAVIEHLAERNAPAAVAIRALERYRQDPKNRPRPSVVTQSHRTYEQVLFGIYQHDLSEIVASVAQNTLSTR